MNSTGSATCRNCQTLFANVPLEGDENDVYLALEVRACSVCLIDLCKCCPQVETDCCGETICAEHVVTVPDGTPRPLRCCPACAAEIAAEDAPARKPVAPELRPALVAVAGKVVA